MSYSSEFKKISTRLVTLPAAIISCVFFNNLCAAEFNVKLATTDWCPYSCINNGPNQGLAYDYVKYILKQRNIELEVTSYPWARAIKQVEKGERHGLLTAVPSESPGLLFTQVPMMSYQMCFFGKSESEWKYVDQNSLEKIRLGVISEYGYGEPVDEYLANVSNTHKVLELSSNHVLQRLISLVELEKIDVLIEDRNVINWHYKNNQEHAANKLKNLGCLQEESFYLAMSPELSWSQDVVRFLNDEFEKENNQKWLAEYTQAYYQ